MSKGNQIITFRITPELLQEMERAIESSNVHRFDEPRDRTAWICHAIRSKLDHLKRSRRPRRLVQTTGDGACRPSGGSEDYQDLEKGPGPIP